MDKARDINEIAELVSVRPAGEITVMPPNSGVVGTFLEHTANMFRARSMRMNGLLRKIDESGLRMESLLRTALETSEAAEAALREQFHKEGLVPKADAEDN